MGSSIRIVVADDNEIVRQMIVDSLCEDDGIEVVGEASDGATAVKLIKETRPDIVLLDLVMPLVDGIGVMETINSDATFKERKPQYVVISAAGSEDIVNQALQTGASYFIMKPFDGDALIKRIKRVAGEMESAGYQGTIHGEIKEGTM
ncbi:MAG: response regulator, partial [Butyrivibrio sp.]